MNNIWIETLRDYGISFVWIMVATAGFSIALAIGLKIFDWFSRDIDESDALKKKNYGVAIIFAVFIIVVSLIVSKVLTA